MEERMSPARPDTFDWTREESVSAAVIYAVTDTRGVDPTAIEPLFETIDPDALDALFAADRVSDAPHLSVEFTYGDYRIRVAASGEGRIVEDS